MFKFILVTIIIVMLAAVPFYFFTKKEPKHIENKIPVAEKPVKKEKPKVVTPEVEEETSYTITRDNTVLAKSFSDISGIWNEVVVGGYTQEVGFEFNVASKIKDPSNNTLTLKNNIYSKTYNKSVCDSPVTLKAHLKFNSEGQFALEDTDFEGCENFYFTPNEVKIKSATFYKYEKNYLVLVMNEVNMAIVFKRQR